MQTQMTKKARNIIANDTAVCVKRLAKTLTQCFHFVRKQK